jgi:hypothetical protein
MKTRKARRFTMPKKDGVYRCPGCGCSQNNACLTTSGWGCHWMEDGRCSCCHDPSTRVTEEELLAL